MSFSNPTLRISAPAYPDSATSTLSTPEFDTGSEKETLKALCQMRPPYQSDVLQ